ncbi:hypothetical protein C9374_014653 [Naegleria lovaniensis]|uniref:Uncharacterized protein n=1 Tax=Naegleria lovaniensis TaxID=51637 RepID=A0AA88GZH4_NAELO|nr:uncharacterized protein C9374_014653 [Naegleria lovaniensis]KAG2389253.1 hypothetical protein C9374_014653 [Naegleria lovaniensis]
MATVAPLASPPLPLEYLVYKTVFWIETNSFYQMYLFFEELNKASMEQQATNGPRNATAAYYAYHGAALAAPVKPLQIIDLINHYDKCFRRRPLYSACAKGSLPLVRYLVDLGARVNDLNESEHTALWIASNHGHYEIVKFLLKRGADKNMKCKKGKSPKDIASERGHLHIVELLENFDYEVYKLIRKRKQMFKSRLLKSSNHAAFCDVSVMTIEEKSNENLLP